MSCNTTVLCVLDHQIAAHRDPETGVIALDTFKMVYVAPMKALVQECVLNFGKRLAAFGITVRELSGDQSLTRAQASHSASRRVALLFTTPVRLLCLAAAATRPKVDVRPMMGGGGTCVRWGPLV
jgi:hypothetical protein